jgi:transglutaminase-like putative cysteine protease
VAAVNQTAHHRPPPAGELSVASEVALIGLTVAAVISFGRLFDDGRFFGPVFVAAVTSHLVARAGRRMGLGLPLAALLSLAAGTIALVNLIEPATTTYGIPRGDSWRAIGDDLRQAWTSFSDVVAPTRATEGFVASAVIGTWVAAFLADVAAFRALATFEAIIPSMTLFVFSSALGPDRHRVRYTVIYLAALLMYVLVRTATRRADTTSWFAGRRGGGASAIVRGGVGLAGAGVVVAAIIGPVLPGANSDPLIAWRNRDGDGGPRNRITVSPLVDIKERLVNQSENELLVVETSNGQPSYWRLTALDRFDGRIWSSENTYKDAGGSLPEGEPSRAREQTLQQEFKIGRLSTIWLPAAFRPERLTGLKDARYDKESGSLLSPSVDANGLSYTVTSKLPRLTEALLEPVRSQIPNDIRDRYLQLPGDFPAEVTAEAEGITDGADSPYETALALQQYFRDGNFTYDEQVPPGHGDDAITRFLFDTRTGYCEQFAGTYAAMARAIGLPSRVAVGFQPGLQREDGTFHVRGKDAHAWPEVYLNGYGWVAFEPTPSRVHPGAESYTRTETYRIQTEDGSQPPATVAPTTTSPTSDGSPSNRDVRDLDAGGGRSGGGSGPAAWWRRPMSVLAVLAGAGALGLALVPPARAYRRRRRRTAATTPRKRVLLAWEEAEEILAIAAGLPRRPAETPLEYAARVTAPASLDRDRMTTLAHDTTAARFSAAEVDETVALEAESAVADVRRTLLGRATAAQRVLWAVDPRTLR